jgi:hypothetical protein
VSKQFRNVPFWLKLILFRRRTKAYEWELITEDVLRRVWKVKLINGENKRLRYLSEEEAEGFV